MRRRLPGTVSTRSLISGVSFFNQRRGASHGVRVSNWMEQAMEENARFCRKILENAVDMVYTHDLEGRFTFTNGAGERLTGYDRAALLETSSATVFGPEYERAMRDLIAQALRSPCSTMVELEVVTKDGQRRLVEVSMQPMYGDGTVVAIQ